MIMYLNFKSDIDTNPLPDFNHFSFNETSFKKKKTPKFKIHFLYIRPFIPAYFPGNFHIPYCH